MEAIAKARLIKFSPYKLRFLADGMRGKTIKEALNWLHSRPSQRCVVLFKVLHSAWSNAKVKAVCDFAPDELFVKSIQVDQGPVFKYTKPASKGSGKVLARRSCHISVCVSQVAAKSCSVKGS